MRGGEDFHEDNNEKVLSTYLKICSAFFYMKNKKDNYTCSDYRQEMILLGLRKQLNDDCLTDKERKQVLNQIEKLEEKMGLQ
jgi:hypothetical protein